MEQLTTQRRPGFTLIEMLTAMAVMSLIMVCLITLTGQIGDTWKKTSGRVDAFREARSAFESISRQISQATLNTYHDYYGYASASATGTLVPRTNSNRDTFIPVTYQRQSELRFITGPAASLIATTFADTLAATGEAKPVRTSHCLFFQAPLGFTESGKYSSLSNLVNTWGYYVEYAGGKGIRPAFLSTGTTSSGNRFRLMEMMEPSEVLTVYRKTSGNPGYNGKDWFQTPLAGGIVPEDPSTRESYSRVMAENIVALILLPKLPPEDEDAVFAGIASGTALSPNYSYDSTSAGQASSYTGNKAGMVNSKHQLPPIVEVTLVAIDQSSADRLERAAASNSSTPQKMLGLDTLFASPSDKAADRKTHLSKLEDKLEELKLSGRTFSSDVRIQGAKWSSSQTN